MTKVGAHCGVVDTVYNAIKTGASKGGSVVQIYLGEKHKTTLKYKYPIDDSEIAEIRKYLKKTGMLLFVHANLTLNLARDHRSSRYKWVTENLIYDLRLTERLGGVGCVIHMGCRLDISVKSAMSNMARSITHALKAVPGKVKILMETTAGGGSAIGATIEEFAQVYKLITPATLRKRVGIVVDTAHIFVAGYDIRTADGMSQFWKLLDKEIGYSHVDLIHLNDSQTELGSRSDRHANLGEGYIFNPELGGSEDALKQLMQIATQHHIPVVLETRDEGAHRKEIKQLKVYVEDTIRNGNQNKGQKKKKNNRKKPANRKRKTGGRRKRKTGGGKDNKEMIISIFTQLYRIYESLGDNFRAKSYKKIVNELERYPGRVERIEDIKDIPGIGKKSRDRINEIIDTGGLRLLEELKAEGTPLTELTQIIGIGPVKARQLINSGISTPQQLERAFRNGKVRLTNEQQIGLKYRKDLEKKISKREADKYRTQLQSLIREVYPDAYLEMAGSYRKGKRAMKDMDMLVVLPSVKEVQGDDQYSDAIITLLENRGIIQEVFHRGDVQIMTLIRMKPLDTVRHLDLRIIPEHLLPFYLIHFGSGEIFSRHIKLVAKRKGYKVSEYGLFDKRTGKHIPNLKSERDIFGFLDLDYIEPADR